MAIHKIDITSIENIPWARRLIISFYLRQDCFNPDAGSWQFVLEDCGYRSVCSSSWITMTPNTQHPLHSTVIKYAGNYKFVWDYGGLEGLSPADFDSNHSYLVQLVLSDPTCSYVDPCGTAHYTTQYGQAPQGTVNTSGDSFNTSNNCGPNYILRSDSNGCLYCEYHAPTGSDGVSQPDSGWTFSQPSNGTGPGTPHSGGASSGLATGTGVFGTGPIGTGTSGFTFPSSPLTGPSTPSFIFSSFEPGDEPSQVVITPGPEGPGGVPSTNVFGYPALSPLENIYSYEFGTLGASSSEGLYGPGTVFHGRLKGTTYGGASASISMSRTLNAKVAAKAREFLSQNNAIINKRATASQLNLSPNSIRSPDKPDIILNITPNADKTVSPSTKVMDSITTVGQNVYIRSSNNLRSRININGSNDVLNHISVAAPKEISIDPGNKIQSQSSRGLAQARPIGVDSNLGLMSAGNRSPSGVIRKILANVDYAKNTDDFIANFKFDIKSQQNVRVGDAAFFECYLTPRTSKVYRYTLAVLLKTDSSLDLLCTSKTISRAGSIKIADKFPIRYKPGVGYLMAIAYTEQGDIEGVVKVPIKFLDSGTIRGGVLNISSATAAPYKDSVFSLVDPNKSMRLVLGEPDYSIKLITSYLGTSEVINLTAMTVCDNKDITHSISLQDGNVVKYYSTGKITEGGISPVGDYCALMSYQSKRADLNDTILKISSTAPIVNSLTLYIGKDLTYNDISVYSMSYNATTNSYTISLITPFYTTDMSIYHAGSDKSTPTDAVEVAGTTISNGFLITSIACPRYSYIGVALRNPQSVSLAQRTIVWIKGT